MSQADGAQPHRFGYLLAITLAAISFALGCVAWIVGRTPSWPVLLLPLVLLLNGVAGLEMDPFRSQQVRKWYQVIAIAVIVCITVTLVYDISRHVK